MKTRLLVCTGTSGLSAGAGEVVALFNSEIARLNIQDRFEVVSTGDRGLFRDVLVDVIPPSGERLTYEYVKKDHVPQIVKEHLLEGNPVKKLLAGEDYRQFFKGQNRIVLSNCGEIDPENIDDYIGNGGYDALKKTLSMTPVEVVNEVKKSGLKGRGGGGFPTGLKWEFCAKSSGEKKYAICNADEGDPGAFMDRSILEGDPHTVVEGMIIAGYAIGASEGIVYCRAEYPLAISRLKKAILQAGQKGFLGDNIMGRGFSFKLNIKEGAGAFVCGEETSLIKSVEGKRGMPVPRPPFPAVEGLWKKPTLINNVETYANVRHIISRGADWFSAIGTENGKGTKVFALAGKIKNTGLVEVPMGTTIRELVYGPGGGLINRRVPFKGVQLGGPSGGCLPAELLDTPIDYESITKTGAIMGSGGMVVMDQSTCMVDIAKFFVSFTVAESCGKCVPCRIGLNRMLEVLEKIVSGKGEKHHLDFLENMGNSIKETALCGLGNTAPNPVLTTMRYFREEYEAHILHGECPAHVCGAFLKFEIIEDKCTKCGQCSKVCPVDAISWQKGQFPVIDKEKCIRCKSCILACKFMGIK